MYSEGLISRVLSTGQTAIYDPNNYKHNAGASLMLLDRAVASPITDETGKSIGVLYGDRALGGISAGQPIGELEAALLEVLAGAVSSGLARQREEQRRASLTQFFSPRIAELLESQQNLLAGHDAEVTVLFCDIRGFSGVAERVGPQRTIQWINDVLTELSECVMQHDGVLVDYIGDELMAMWGAPGEQADHASEPAKRLAICWPRSNRCANDGRRSHPMALDSVSVSTPVKREWAIQARRSNSNMDHLETWSTWPVVCKV